MQVYFWIVHFLLVLLYLLLFREKHRQHFYSELLILIFLPAAGFLLLVYSRWLRARIQRFGIDKDKLEQVSLLLEKDENTETISAPVKLSNDVVALNDVLYLDDVADKRKLLTTAIRQSALDDSSILKRAIRDSDRDVAHYAVSMATNNLSIMEKQVHQLEKAWDENCEDIQYLKEYAELLQSYIALDVLEEYTLEKLKKRCKEVLIKILTYEDDGYYLEKLINLLLDMGESAEAERIINSFNFRHPEEEQGYLLLLQIYVMQKRHADAARLLAKLKSSQVHFSAEGMKLIRFWNLGVSNA